MRLTEHERERLLITLAADVAERRWTSCAAGPSADSFDALSR
jgi:urease gamma subunit